MLSATHTITGVILAGGKARRMDGQDKGLIEYQHQPLVRYAIDALKPQVDHLVINANRNLQHYQQFGYPVIPDCLPDFCGPLAGMLSVMNTVHSDYILTVPCDSPSLPQHYRQRMMETLLLQQADIAVAHDGRRLQPVYCLIPCRLADKLDAYLQQGERKIDRWLTQFKLAIVDFSDQPDSFTNFNTPKDISAAHNPIASPVPLLGFAAFSGTGKTTLLRQLIPVLKSRNLTLGVIKHAHHTFDIDIPGKDSYEIRKAGAQQTLVASNRLMALMEVRTQAQNDPDLAELLPRLDARQLDLILVEGFKDAAIPKIELHRPALDTPLLYPQDSHIIAVASDQPLPLPNHIQPLDLNEIDIIADFIDTFITHWTS